MRFLALADAAEREGISVGTLYHAARLLDVVRSPSGWSLPPTDDARVREAATVRKSKG
jgi:hypothetical protein